MDKIIRIERAFKPYSFKLAIYQRLAELLDDVCDEIIDSALTQWKGQLGSSRVISNDLDMRRSKMGLRGLLAPTFEIYERSNGDLSKYQARSSVDLIVGADRFKLKRIEKAHMKLYLNRLPPPYGDLPLPQVFISLFWWLGSEPYLHSVVEGLNRSWAYSILDQLGEIIKGGAL